MNPTTLHTDAQTVTLAIIAVVLPFAAFVVNFLVLGKSKASGWVSTLAILGSAVLSLNVFFRVWDSHTIHMQQVWFTIGATKVQIGILLNNLSVLMLVLVSLIALPVHIYSTAYMKDDTGYSRYFRYLSFFCFSMLALVVVDSLITFYAFWELVGFSSYLLIGFWYDRDSAVQANKKAFIMNRIGDIGLLSAIIILFTQFGTFDIDLLFGEHGRVSQSVIFEGFWNAVPLHDYEKGTSLPAIWHYIAFGGILLAVAAKSAQFPLHTWLPDAMEGPTSVSALIHAATMVAAGVFLLGRVYPFFSPEELTILAAVGCFTAFMAATIALTQNDLKRILAYSTISQLGYMVMAMGVGAYSSSLFHLVTHAFFKCLLFLVAGIVIHQIKHIKEDNHLDIDPQDIRHMGGLRKKLPLTFIAAVIAGLALVGFPLTSGFLSKDGILIQAFEWSEGKNILLNIIPIMALLTSWLTAFYVARLIFKVFFGELSLLKTFPSLQIHIGDGHWAYKLPLVFLALCCLFPLFSFNPISYENSWLYHAFALKHEAASNYHLIIPVLVTVVSLLVIYRAYLLYAKREGRIIAETGLLYRISFNEWYIDRFYRRVIVKFVIWLSGAAYWFDRNVIDGFITLLERINLCIAKAAAWCDKYIVDGVLWLAAETVQYIGNFARRFHGGKVQYYLYSMLLAVIAVFIIKLIWA
ncbi:NADH-quinone oxidoreductase subunit L [Mucilaginibacter psychrotolerans]|uniref:NADH-quinone oxidoreductase subunit L n=1 Tax=Mucilaginibacter psychrotolerans TaxID=1524096 RepID=A0A4Y8S527_9SPHI|nr:NADH-quinone oxidoreductase subunit L [Mucilaginibacter psychrotolerans]TFF33735.1 NADH-quinone oxidoreductase subunit L [Mucilaginibacter psychrotolerans]